MEAAAKDNRLFVEAVLYRYRQGYALPEWFEYFRVVQLIEEMRMGERVILPDSTQD